MSARSAFPLSLLVRGICLLLVFAGIGVLLFRESDEADEGYSLKPEDLTQTSLSLHSEMPPAEGMNCRACHARIVAQWESSQHALANRLLKDSPLKPGVSRFGNVNTVIDDSLRVKQTRDDGFEFSSLPVSVIGVEPLVQALVETERGAWQVFNPAYHVHTNGWFNAFPEVRDPGEWGHWTGRAMNWNSRCAWCHMTEFKKGYDLETDSYESRWTAMGIACAQCHGNTVAHAANPDLEAAVRFDRITAQDNCISCHSRREFLTEEAFTSGDEVHDHFRIALLDQPGVYYADGQVLDENFEATSFLSSKMHDAGVTCFDCHNPHSGGLILPDQNNALCMSCHTAPGRMGAPPIQPTVHSHHEEFSAGNRCVECHMPHTEYMQSDLRRDHGFHSPDPLLTKELGIPNACSRCHTDQTVEWAITHAEKWYGEGLEPRRERTRVVAAAQAGESRQGKALLGLIASESNAVWRASLVSLLRPYLDEEGVANQLVTSLKDESELVRSMAVQGVALVPGLQGTLRSSRKDESRLVRLNALWNTLSRENVSAKEREELEGWLRVNEDDAVGLLNRAQAALRTGKPQEVPVWTERMLKRDNSAGPNLIAGQLLHAAGFPDQAKVKLERVVAIDPQNVEGWVVLGMFRGEQGDLPGAMDAFRRTVVADPEHGRAWYNLGLAQLQSGDRDAGLLSLGRAEALLEQSPDPSYAIATVYAQDGNPAKALEFLNRALERQPRHRPSLQLRMQLMSP